MAIGLRTRLATATILCWPAVAAAQTAPVQPETATRSAQGDVAVTIYNNDLALVQDTRQLALPRGRSVQEFADVSAQIRPETVTLTAAGTGIVEQNFDYDLLSPEKLMDKAVGQTVTLVRTDAKGGEIRESARILANNGGTVVQIGSRIEILDRYGGRVIFPSLPPNLRARPTLSVTLDSTASGARPATLNYLSRGLGWKADYVALFDEKAGKLDVQGWITLTNTSGTTFTAAKTLLVAGSVGGGQQWRLSPQLLFASGGGAARQSGGHGNGGARAARRFLHLSASRTHHDSQRTDQASQLPRCRRRARIQGLFLSQCLVAETG